MGKSTIILKNNIRIHAVDMTDVAQIAIDTHKPKPLPGLILATSIATFGALASIKENMDMSVVFKVEGVIKTIIVEAKHNGDIKALVGNPNITTDFDDKDINQIPIKVGLGEKGTLHVTNFIGETHFGSQVEMAKGDIVTDLAYYLDQSEQTRSAVVSDINFKDASEINRAYSVIFQMLPGFNEEDIQFVEEFIKNVKLSEMTMDEYISKIDGKVAKTREFNWKCDFSIEKALDVVRTLSKEDQAEIIKEHGFIEIKDQFCNVSYKFKEKDLSE